MLHRCAADAFEPYLTPYDCDTAKTTIVARAGGAYSERVLYWDTVLRQWLVSMKFL